MAHKKVGRHAAVPEKQKGLEGFVSEHEAISAVLLFLVCLAAFVGLFLFIVFSDFSGSADFVYNSF